MDDLTPDEMRRNLAQIDSHVESVANHNPAGSDLNELAYAIHNLVMTLDGIVNRLGRS